MCHRFAGQEAPREAVCHPQRNATVPEEGAFASGNHSRRRTVIRRSNVIEQHTRVTVRNASTTSRCGSETDRVQPVQGLDSDANRREQMQRVCGPPHRSTGDERGNDRCRARSRRIDGCHLSRPRPDWAVISRLPVSNDRFPVVLSPTPLRRTAFRLPTTRRRSSRRRRTDAAAAGGEDR